MLLDDLHHHYYYSQKKRATDSQSKTQIYRRAQRGRGCSFSWAQIGSRRRLLEGFCWRHSCKTVCCRFEYPQVSNVELVESHLLVQSIAHRRALLYALRRMFLAGPTNDLNKVMMDNPEYVLRGVRPWYADAGPSRSLECGILFAKGDSRNLLHDSLSRVSQEGLPYFDPNVFVSNPEGAWEPKVGAFRSVVRPEQWRFTNRELTISGYRLCVLEVLETFMKPLSMWTSSLPAEERDSGSQRLVNGQWHIQYFRSSRVDQQVNRTGPEPW